MKTTGKKSPKSTLSRESSVSSLGSNVSTRNTTQTTASQAISVYAPLLGQAQSAAVHHMNRAEYMTNVAYQTQEQLHTIGTQLHTIGTQLHTIGAMLASTTDATVMNYNWGVQNANLAEHNYNVATQTSEELRKTNIEFDRLKKENQEKRELLKNATNLISKDMIPALLKQISKDLEEIKK